MDDAAIPQLPGHMEIATARPRDLRDCRATAWLAMSIIRVDVASASVATHQHRSMLIQRGHDREKWGIMYP